MIKKNILIADTESMVTDFLTELLVKEGYGVISSNDSHEALQKVKAGRFDLIMVDVDMVRIHGFDIKKSHVPMIIMSGSGIGPSLINALTKGVDEYIPKPSDIELIRKKVKGCLEKHGFTLIELLMVCALIIISSLIVVPKLINFMGTNDLEIEVRKLRAKIRNVQQLAIAKQITYRLEFDLSNESYNITYNSGGGSYMLVETINLKDNIGVESTTFTSPASNTVSFDYFGAPSQAGDIIFKDERRDKTATIGIAAATGKVDIR